MLRTSDQEILSAIGHGEREFGWAEWFGDVDGADYLTSAGREAARSAIKDLTSFFGAGWLSRAIEPGPDGAPVRILGRFAPLLALAPPRRPGLYVESIRWWASIQTLIEAAVDGLGAVRREVRKDLSTHRLVHTLTQARLASVGRYLGAAVALEPGKSGGPGDVLLRWRGHDVFFEVVTFGPDENNEFEDRHHDQHFQHLAGLRPTEAIYWEGDIPGFLNKTDEAAWIQVTTEAAARLRADRRAGRDSRPRRHLPGGPARRPATRHVDEGTVPRVRRRHPARQDHRPERSSDSRRRHRMDLGRGSRRRASPQRVHPHAHWRQAGRLD